MGTKKIKGKSTGTAKKSAKKGKTGKSQKAVDMDRVRENITNLVGASANEITKEVIEDAKKGALASTKYLFEVAGLYPATEASAAPEENWMQNTLIKRLVEPEATNDEDAEEAPDCAAVAAAETANPDADLEKSAVEGKPVESVN